MSNDKGSVVVKVELLTQNFDKALLTSASTGESLTDTINRAIAFYHEVIQLQPGMEMSWMFVDGAVGKLIRLR